MRSEGPRYKDGGKIAKYKQGSGGGSVPLQNLDYNLVSGGGRGVSGGRDFRISPTIIKTPAPYMGSMAGSPPKAVGLTLKKRFKKGGEVQTSADTAKKLATEMGGMKKGGKTKKDGLAVMIAIGSPMKGMKKPVKKMHGGRIHDEDKVVNAMNKVRNS
jgi:hypothetical protein